MSRRAVIENGKVVNVIMSDDESLPELTGLAGIDWDYDGGNFADNRPAPEQVRKTIYSKFSFKGLFTKAEWRAIKQSEDDNVIDFIDSFKIADYIDIDHVGVSTALGYFEGIGLLEAGRADEIRDV